MGAKTTFRPHLPSTDIYFLMKEKRCEQIKRFCRRRGTPCSRPARLASASTTPTAPAKVSDGASMAMHTRAPCHGRRAAVVAAAVVAVVVVMLVIVVAAAAAAAGLDGVAGSMEDSVPAGVVVEALDRCPGSTVFVRLVPKVLSRADLFASVRRQASEEGTAFL